jgi:predicted ATP-dependent protease
VNVAGGLKISQPGCDLALAIAIISSALRLDIRQGIAFIGEIGLNGELRRGGKGMVRGIDEAKVLGFKYIVVPKSLNFKESQNLRNSKVNAVENNDWIIECSSLIDAVEFALSGFKEYISKTRRKKSKYQRKIKEMDNDFDDDNDSNIDDDGFDDLSDDIEEISMD